MVRYRHIVLRGVGKAPGSFRARGVPVKERIPPVDDRAAHGDRLLKELAQAAEAFDETAALQHAAGVKKSGCGLLLAVSGREDVRLKVGDARSSSRGRKLYGVRRASRPGERDLATFFLNEAALATLERNLTAYGNYATPTNQSEDDDFEDESTVDEEVTGKPPGFKLFETAGEIRVATYRDLWTDDIEKLPTKRDKTDWEVWVRKDLTDIFVGAILGQSIERSRTATEFVEVMVQNVRATPEQIESLVKSTGSVVELRSASQLGDGNFNLPDEKRLAANGMAARIAPVAGARPRVTLLDTGVDHSNPLLSSSIDPANCHTVVQAWGVSDHDGHGTKMAGVVQFLDLAQVVNGTATIGHYSDLESVVVTAPAGATRAPARWAIEQGVKKVEDKAKANRVFCLAQTAPDEANTGRGTSTSAAVDKLAYGDGETPRLFCVAAGNVPVNPTEPYQIADYDDRNARFGIESPGQAFNAITVGGMTSKTAGTAPVAPTGDLSPTSRSAVAWDGRHPGKPDIVLEAGNFQRQPGGVFAVPYFPNFVLTTSKGGSSGSELTWTGETSAATARAAGLLGRTMWSYPHLMPETVRGLLVHSAEWTAAMRQEYERVKATRGKQQAAATTFNRYGWGSPNEQRLYTSQHNDFTFVVEDEIQPYAKAKPGSPIRINEMKYFKLPWPREALLRANQAKAEMKCTLSYFIEPAPHAYARSRYDRYYSARLQFDVKQHDESDSGAQSQFNEYEAGTASLKRFDGWDLGEIALRGSIHQDTWHGRAYALADRDGISVVPAKGWWSEAGADGHFDRKIRFALIVSLRVEADVDLITEASTRIIPDTLVQGLVPVQS